MTDSMEQMESQSTGLPAKRAKGSIKGGRRVPFPVELDKALPKYDGPKLDAFQHHDATIEFISLLSAESPGDDAHVFEVVIQSKHYALKVVWHVPVIELFARWKFNSSILHYSSSSLNLQAIRMGCGNSDYRKRHTLHNLTPFTRNSAPTVA